MVTIEVNKRPVEAKDGELLLTVLRRAGIRVPTLCHMEGLLPTGACRMCVVEVQGRPNLVPSCACQVVDGMKVQTHSQRVLEARRTIVELLLGNHPDECLYCARNKSCELQSLASELAVDERPFTGMIEKPQEDVSSMSIVRDPAKCILCGRCVRVCEEIQQVGAIDFIGRGCQTRIGAAFDVGLNVSSCIHCGQCILVCPTGALQEQSHLDAVINAIRDPKVHVVVQHAPSVSVTLGEEFGLKPGADVNGVMVAAMREIGFDRVFDTSFSADLTIMEEASELVHRIVTGGPLPLFTSCSPGWVKFVEEFYPELLPNVSSCKSPQQMMGAIVKTYYAEQQGLDPHNIFSVSIMPCTAKKFEASRPEMARHGVPDVDAVLTTREFARLIKLCGLDLHLLQPDLADSPFGERSSAGKIFGATGGVMEAALRTAHFLITGAELAKLEVQDVRGLQGVKEAHVPIGDLTVGVAVVNGVGNAHGLLRQLRDGRDDLHFIEVMTCPGGCIAGGGQPLTTNLDAVKARMARLYAIDMGDSIRTSHGNQSVKRLYDEFLGKPLGERSHALLHTHYAQRKVLV